ncbi:hypothetical protein CMO96_00670 [Candidatus Woesebacteria bacterium]|nr:hypothetical protein [Candidatus Woesebacteria bacterium]
MYSPKYIISNQILKNIGVIEACREVIENAPLIPSYERQFQEEARLRTVHHGTHIEGNELSFEQAGRLFQKLNGETSAEKAAQKADLVARERDIQEVINYRAAMDYVDGVFRDHKDRGIGYGEEMIKTIHRLTVDRVVPEDVQGEYRQTQVVLRDSRSGEVTFRPPPAVEIPYLMSDFIDWLNRKGGAETHPVIRAAIVHYALAAIHPFVEGNGRSARAFTTLILFAEGYDTKKIFSLEEYFDRDSEAYYRTLIATSDQAPELSERDLTGWIEYFTEGLAIELARVRDRVRKLSIDTKIRRKRGKQVALSERQIRIVEYLSENDLGVMGEFKGLFPMISDDTVLRELQDLTKKDIIKKKGQTKGSHYELVK